MAGREHVHPTEIARLGGASGDLPEQSSGKSFDETKIKDSPAATSSPADSCGATSSTSRRATSSWCCPTTCPQSRKAAPPSGDGCAHPVPQRRSRRSTRTRPCRPAPRRRRSGHPRLGVRVGRGDRKRSGRPRRGDRRHGKLPSLRRYPRRFYSRRMRVVRRSGCMSSTSDGATTGTARTLTPNGSVHEPSPCGSPPSTRSRPPKADTATHLPGDPTQGSR